MKRIILSTHYYEVLQFLGCRVWGYKLVIVPLLFSFFTAVKTIVRDSFTQLSENVFFHSYSDLLYEEDSYFLGGPVCYLSFKCLDIGRMKKDLKSKGGLQTEINEFLRD